MRNLKTFILTVCVLFIAGTINAQKIKLISGSLDALKSETSINVEFTYDKNMQIGKKTEATYVAEKKEEYNKKEAGKGDQWALSWVADRKEKYEVKFTELFSENGIQISYTPAKYTLIFHTIATEPGFNIFITKKYADIDAEVTIVETANKSNVIAKISVMNAPGRTYGYGDLDTGVRIQEAYATAGKYLGKFIKKGK